MAMLVGHRMILQEDRKAPKVHAPQPQVDTVRPHPADRFRYTGQALLTGGIPHR